MLVVVVVVVVDLVVVVVYTVVVGEGMVDVSAVVSNVVCFAVDVVGRASLEGKAFQSKKW